MWRFQIRSSLLPKTLAAGLRVISTS
uniref:Uncharacterized protein n=1 Tax=Rhizophora mucronata TaxID=61149 RepID=A0A2P2NY35_RHIMU